jgi:hypothetical protein
MSCIRLGCDNNVYQDLGYCFFHLRSFLITKHHFDEIGIQKWFAIMQSKNREALTILIQEYSKKQIPKKRKLIE